MITSNTVTSSVTKTSTKTKKKKIDGVAGNDASQATPKIKKTKKSKKSELEKENISVVSIYLAFSLFFKLSIDITPLKVL